MKPLPAGCWPHLVRVIDAATLERIHPEVTQMSQSELIAELVPDVSLMPDNRIEAAVARRLMVAREIICRDLLEQMKERAVMDSPSRTREWLKLYCAGLEHEVFLVMYLDAQHCLIHAEQLFRGTLNQTSVYPREVVKQALAHNALSVIFAHNHPSGQAECSRSDEQITRDLLGALALVDIRVLDHFIVVGDALFSFSERGLL
jgi:DNA repair protein RadC